MYYKEKRIEHSRVLRKVSQSILKPCWKYHCLLAPDYGFWGGCFVVLLMYNRQLAGFLIGQCREARPNLLRLSVKDGRGKGGEEVTGMV